MLKVTEKLSFLLLAMLIIALPLIFWVDNFEIPPFLHSITLFGNLKESFARGVTLILFCTLIIQIGFWNRPVIKTHIYGLLLVLILYQALSLLWAVNPHQGFQDFLHWTALFMFFCAVLNIPKDRETLQTLMSLALIPAFIVCVICISCYYLDTDLPFFMSRPFSYSATFGNYKFAAEYLTPIIFWTVPLFIKEKSSLKKGMAFVTFIAILFAIFFVFKSRASLLGFLSTLPLIATYVAWLGYRRLSTRYRKVMLRSTIALGLLLLSLIPLGLKNKRFHALTNHIPQISTGTHIQRLIIWKNTLSMVHDHFWTGVGIGNFNLHYSTYSKPQDRYHFPVTNGWTNFIRQTHNEFLQLFSELGFVGLCLMLLALMIVFRGVVLHLKESPHDALAIGLLFSLVSAGIISFFVFNFHNPTSSFYMVLTLAFLIHSTTRSHLSLRRKPKGLVTILSVLVASAVLTSTPTWFKHSIAHYYKLRGRAIVETQPYPAMEQFKTSLAWNPHNWESHFLLGRVYGERAMIDRGVSHMKRALELNPNHIPTLYNIGLYLNASRHYKEARQHFERIIHIAPDYRKAYNQLGMIAYQDGDCTQARHYLNQAFKPAAYQAEELPDTLRFLAYCNIKEGKLDRTRHQLFEVYLRRPTLLDPAWVPKLID